MSIRLPVLFLMGLTAACSQDPQAPRAEEVRLHASGDAPRVTAAAHPAPSHVRLRIAMNMHVDAPGSDSAAANLAPVDVDVDVSPAPADPADRTLLHVTLRDAAVAGEGSDPTRTAELREELERQDPAGLRGVLEIRPLNHAVQAAFPAPLTAGPNVRELLGQVEQALALLCLPIPGDPIGPGSQWRVERSLTLRGITWRQSCEVALRAVENGVAVLEVTTTLDAPPQPYQPDNLPPGARGDLVEARARGHATLHTVLGAPLPTDADLTIRFDLRWRLIHEAQAQELRSTVDSQVHLGAASP